MKKTGREHRHNYIFLLYLVVITFVVTSVSLSRYTKTVDFRDEARVARVVIDYVTISAALNGTPIMDLSGGLSLTDMEPGDELVYTFEIRNYDGTYQNEVKMKYLISVTFDPDPLALPVTYPLTPADTYPSAGSGWTVMPYAPGNIAHSYTLTITWDEDDIDSGYTGQTQTVQIDIDSQQID